MAANRETAWPQQTSTKTKDTEAKGLDARLCDRFPDCQDIFLSVLVLSSLLVHHLGVFPDLVSLFGSGDLGSQREPYTVVPRSIGHPVNRTPRMSGHASSGTQPRESNGKKSKKRIKNEDPNVL